MRGWVAASGSLEMGAILLFSVQFIWQFPHFWAIAWLGHDAYTKAGYYLLPSKGGRNKSSALQCVIYAAMLFPITLFLTWFGLAGWITTFILLVAAATYTFYAWQLYQSCSLETAKKLMFSSFFYLPIVMIALLLNAIL
jgi:protoheme IX farnesyltransferase